MNGKKIGLTAMRIAVPMVLALAVGLANPRQSPPPLAQADTELRRGGFDQAFQLYLRAADEDSASYGAALGAAKVALLRNSLVEAEKWLGRAIALKPQEPEPQALMGEVLYRRDQYAQAAPFFETAGRKPRAEIMRAFTGKVPFSLSQTRIYAGGRQGSTQQAVADRVQLGEFSLRNVPVVIAEQIGPLPVDGVIGTVVLYHFLFTLDYPGSRLVLRRNSPEASRSVRIEAESAGAAVVPFWLAGDHYIHAWGKVNGKGPYLLLVDTGMAGGGFSCPEYVVKEAGIEISKEGFQGVGGGGPITVYPFTANLSLGDARRDNVQGFYGAIPAGSEERLGFRTGGIISHGFFREFSVTFDFRAMTLYLNRVG